ncbi:MAG: uridine kinase [Erysipelotrichaceae bacterium]
MSKPLIIGIAGGSASGKTSISRQLYEAFSNYKSFVIIKQDDYYKCQDHLPMEQRIKNNYDHPFAFENDLFQRDLLKLINNECIEKPTYDFVNHTRSKQIEIVLPCDVIVLEGLFILEEEAIRDLCDIKVFVDTPSDVRFIRRLVRDVNERGRSLDSIVSQYLTTVRDMHEQFIEPSKRYANIIIPEGGNNRVAIDLLITKIKSIIY